MESTLKEEKDLTQDVVRDPTVSPGSWTGRPTNGQRGDTRSKKEWTVGSLTYSSRDLYKD